MPQAEAADSLAPPQSQGLFRCATAPEFLHFARVDRYAEFERESQNVTDSPPPKSIIPMKFFPIPSKYSLLMGMNAGGAASQSGSSADLHSGLGSEKPEKPAFTLGAQEDKFDEDFHMLRHRDFGSISPPVHMSSTQSTPSVSPLPPRKKSIDSKNSKSTGFLGWLMSSPQQHDSTDDVTFFHQKEDMVPQRSTIAEKARKIRQGGGSRSNLMPTMSDINVFTPTEY